MKINKNDFVRARVHTTIPPGEALKLLRELQNLSQNDLVRLTDISQPNISAIENGTKQLGRERALVLARALHVHPAVLLFPDFDCNFANAA
jgi:transcriptional regulator with XRE-family HTH domain